MNNLVSDRKTGSLLIGLFVIVFLFAFYYYIIQPKQLELEMKENSVTILHSEIQSIQDDVNPDEVDKESEESTFVLEKKIPTTRDLDQIIRSLEEIEFISDSQIQSIVFNNYDSVLSESELLSTYLEDNKEGTEEGVAETETVVEPISPVALVTLPPELKLITLNINVSAKSYEQLKIFINEIEQLERVYRIDSVNFSLPGEMDIETQPDDSLAITADIQLTTFYYDSINE